MKIILELKDVNEDYKDDIDGNLNALLESVDFAQSIEIEVIDEDNDCYQHGCEDNDDCVCSSNLCPDRIR